MNFFNMIADFIMMPVDQIMLWIQELEIGLGNLWAELLTNATIGVTQFLVEGVSVCVISYSVYCAFRIICCDKDETFSTYINKTMIAGLCYFFAKCGGNILLHSIGV